MLNLNDTVKIQNCYITKEFIRADLISICLAEIEKQ